MKYSMTLIDRITDKISYLNSEFVPRVGDKLMMDGSCYKVKEVYVHVDINMTDTDGKDVCSVNPFQFRIIIEEV